MRFLPGDRVVLVKKFDCYGDDQETDDAIDKELREAFGKEPITGTVTAGSSGSWPCVDFDKTGDEYDFPLFVNDECLDFLIGPTEEEIRELFGVKK